MESILLHQQSDHCQKTPLKLSLRIKVPGNDLQEIIYIKNRLTTCLLRGMNHTDNIHSVIKNLQWLFRFKGIENETRIIQQQILKKEEPVEPAKVRSKYFRRCVSYVSQRMISRLKVKDNHHTKLPYRVRNK